MRGRYPEPPAPPGSPQPRAPRSLRRTHRGPDSAASARPPPPHARLTPRQTGRRPMAAPRAPRAPISAGRGRAQGGQGANRGAVREAPIHQGMRRHGSARGEGRDGTEPLSQSRVSGVPPEGRDWRSGQGADPEVPAESGNGPSGAGRGQAGGPRWGGRRPRCCCGSGQVSVPQRNGAPAPPSCPPVPVGVRGSTWS